MLQRRYRNRVRLRCKFGLRVSAQRFNRVTGLILNKMQVGAARGDGNSERRKGGRQEGKERKRQGEFYYVKGSRKGRERETIDERRTGRKEERKEGGKEERRRKRVSRQHGFARRNA